MDRAVIKDLGARVKDLTKPRQSIYWLDLVACIAVAVIGLYVSEPFPGKILAGSPVALCGVVVAAFALYRASYFNHELAHHGRDLRAFTIGWKGSPWKVGELGGAPPLGKNTTSGCSCPK